MRFLEAHHAGYFGKAQELKESVSGWLSFIPATFPHYTRHTIEHSEEIISQMSKLLFENGNYQKPILPELSGIEAYILVASAYLHDAGMTVSDAEKTSILQSAEWREWVENGGGAVRFREISDFRASKEGNVNETTRNFLADVQLRFLIAEYVRRTHHIRGGEILALHQNEMGRFAYGDPVLVKTIAAVCVAHGLQQSELNDPERYPERRDIRDEQVNVRLLAVLLRLGDLLDMSYDRACPLLLNAASPIPAGSLAHWTQYQRIEHKMVAHDKIEFTAYCNNEEEHRFLHDWCAWLVSELDQARRLMVRSARHADWIPPLAIIDQASNNTINIKPATGARYIPAQWRFELDTKAIFDRLIYDALDTPWDFLRELLQNAADATRCRMFADLQESEGSTPQYPTQVDERVRKMYPIRVILSTVDVRNEMSGENEQRQVLTVEDLGLGMDKDVVQKYLLQVGRSFYTTREFRDDFGFVASSRFGIGFLSVFSASEDVTIETYKPTSLTNAEPLKLRLTGPRSYLLTERGNRRKSGTSIQIVLRKPAEVGEITSLVKQWCSRVEFPVLVNELGVQTEIQAERAEEYVKQVPDVWREGASLVVRTFPVNREGIEGDLFVLAQVSDEGELWSYSPNSMFNKQHPNAVMLSLPKEAFFFHGINTTAKSDDEDWDGGTGNKSYSLRIDLRGERFIPAITRTKSRFNSENGPMADINIRWNELLREHLDTTAHAKGEDKWIYKQRLYGDVGTYQFWLTEPDTILIARDGALHLVSVAEVTAVEYIYVLLTRKGVEENKLAELIPQIKGTVITQYWLSFLCSPCNSELFDNRELDSVELGDIYVLCKWKLSATRRDTFEFLDDCKVDIEPALAGGKLNRIGYSYPVAVNRFHPLGKWLLAVEAAAEQGFHGITITHVSQIRSLIHNGFSFMKAEFDDFEEYCEQWIKMPGLPAELMPPTQKLTSADFW